jgi:hypothetical protein
MLARLRASGLLTLLLRDKGRLKNTSRSCISYCSFAGRSDPIVILRKRARAKSLLAESLLALFSCNIAVVDRADFGRGWALVQVLHELVQSALLALGLASNL